MSDQAAQLAKTRQQVESELMEILRLRQHEWATANDDQRDFARQLFMNALQNFNSLVLYGRPPDRLNG